MCGQRRRNQKRSNVKATAKIKAKHIGLLKEILPKKYASELYVVSTVL